MTEYCRHCQVEVKPVDVRPGKWRGPNGSRFCPADNYWIPAREHAPFPKTRNQIERWLAE